MSPSTTSSTPRVDVPVAVRGASTGFGILLIGGLLSPLVATVAPVIGGVALAMTSIIAFHVASRRIGRASVPVLHGAVAAVFAYALVLPLVLRVPEGRNLPQILLTLAMAISVGGASAWITARNRA